MRLGRKLNHDPRSKQYAAAQSSKLHSVSHTINGDPLNQGNIGSCVANASTHFLNYLSPALHDEAFAVDLYQRATAVDSFPGQYPPDDTGTDALSAAKVLVSEGLISAYHHAFGLKQMLAALMLSPVLVGTEWYESMFTPNRYGTIVPRGQSEGGHEYIAYRYDHAYVSRDGFPVGWVWFRNSWGKEWGKNGCFRMSTLNVDYLLRQQGDCMVLVK